MASAAANSRRMVVIGTIIGIHIIFYIGLKAGLTQSLLQSMDMPILADLVQPDEAPPPKEPPPPPPDFKPPPILPPPSIDLPMLSDGPPSDTAISIPSQPVRPVEAAPAPPPPVPPKKALDFFRTNRPPYPSAARRLQEEGSVVTTINVGADGIANCVVKTSSGNAKLDDAVTKWCAGRKFPPAMAAGKPTDFSFALKYTFKLTDE